MTSYPYRPAYAVARPPLHPVLVAFPAACFVGVLLTDVAYWLTAEMMWADFSAWLVSTGVVLTVLAGIVGLIDLAIYRSARTLARGRLYSLGQVLILVLATLNMLVHTHDAWTSVVPWGLVLSAAVVLLLLITVPLGWSMIYGSAGADR